MASFTLDFNANTVGDHYIGYRTYNDAPNTYTVETINVAVPGPQSIEIQVPGNLYCGQIDYDGYIIAACQDQTDSNTNGIPDAAVIFNVVLNKQTDPCVYTEIKCDNAPISSVLITNGGSGFFVGGSVSVTEANVGDELVPAILEIATVDFSGAITGVAIIDPGSYKSTPILSAGAAVLEAQMLDCPLLDLRDYDCNGDNANPSDDPIFSLALEEALELCTDVSTLAGLDPRFLATTDTQCHCRECERYSIENTSGASLYVTAQTCWDKSHPSSTEIVTYTYTIPAGQIVDIGCMMKGTVVLEEENSMNVYPSACS